MYQILNRINSFDNSPFQFARMDYVRGKVDENYRKFVELRKGFAGRLDSSHLLIKILTNLNAEFNGDILSYMSNCAVAADRLDGVLGITSSASHGRLFTEGVFYPGCPEIIMYTTTSNYTVMDLWTNWRDVSPIEVLTHPVTDLTTFELGVMNEARLSHSDLAIINIDIPLLAAQWKLWKAGNPSGTLEAFITQVPLVSMLKSHYNVAFFNRVMMHCGIKRECSVGTNLVFAQIPTNQPADEVIKDLVAKLSNKSLTPNQVLSSIPAIYGSNYLDSVKIPDVAPTQQILWALISQKVDPVSLVLYFAGINGYDRMTNELNKIRRTVIQADQDKFLSNGLSTSAAVYVIERLDKGVLDHMPT